LEFLRRLFSDRGDDGGDGAADDPTPDGDPDAEEQARERELLREDATRLDDELLQRQLRYADRSWAPPAQGGPRRADDAAGDGGSDAEAG
jgi:hypothetical protein